MVQYVRHAGPICLCGSGKTEQAFVESEEHREPTPKSPKWSTEAYHCV